MDIVRKIKKYPESLPFRKPISLKDAPEYFKHIKKPMDLSTIENKVKENEYENEISFCEDVELIINNCK